MRYLKLLSAVALFIPGGTFGHAADTPSSPLIALTEAGALLTFSSDRPADVRQLDSPRCSGQLVGIDLRPADQQLYGLTDRNDLVRLDLAQHSCTVVSTLTVPFGGGTRSGIDFTPQLDRLRCLSAEGQNMRAHPTLGATAIDSPLAYAATDTHAGSRPTIVGAGYTHNLAKAATTTLYAIDATADALVIQEPPNDGVLTTVGALGIDAGMATGFDIVTQPSGSDDAWLATNGKLFRVDLATGKAIAVGPIGDGATAIISLAAVPTPPP